MNRLPILYIPQHAVLLYHYNDDDVEFYAIEAYKKAYLFGDAPNFYDLWDNFVDEIHMSLMSSFYFDGISMSKYELDENMFEFILNRLNMEYVTFVGEHKNFCQNIINEEWI